MSQFILLGAGATVEAGIPEDFISLKVLANQLAKYTNVVNDFVELCHSKGDNIGVEKFLRLISEIAFLNSTELTHEQIVIKRKHETVLPEFALNAFTAFEDMMTVHSAHSVEYLRPLLTHVAQQRGKCQLFSLNVDNSLEVATRSLNLEYVSTPLSLDWAWSTPAQFGARPQIQFNKINGAFDLIMHSRKYYSGVIFLDIYDGPKEKWNKEMLNYRCLNILGNPLSKRYYKHLQEDLLRAAAKSSEWFIVGYSLRTDSITEALIGALSFDSEFARKIIFIDSTPSERHHGFSQFVRGNFPNCNFELRAQSASVGIRQIFGREN